MWDKNLVLIFFGQKTLRFNITRRIVTAKIVGFCDNAPRNRDNSPFIILTQRVKNEQQPVENSTFNRFKR